MPSVISEDKPLILATTGDVGDYRFTSKLKIQDFLAQPHTCTPVTRLFRFGLVSVGLVVGLIQITNPGFLLC